MNTEFVDKLREEYIEKHKKLQIRDELIEENNIERRDVKGYHGREILELLQNADDAYQKSIDIGEKPSCNLEVEINYQNGNLVVSNTGTFFDEEGIKAIVQGNNSPKSGKYIGNKGTGFRSILNWADRIRIFSGEFAVEFSQENARKVFETIKDAEQIQKQLRKCKDLYIPILSVPKNIAHNGVSNRTTIEISVNPEKEKDEYSVDKQLGAIDMRILLFLPNMSKIVICIENQTIQYERNENSAMCDTKGCRNIRLSKSINGEVVVVEEYSVWSKTLASEIEEDGEKKDVSMAIAVKTENVELDDNYIYSYFPLLGADSPVNCLLHATYSLDDHRNLITLNDINRHIVSKQLDFLIYVASKYVERNMLSEAYEILLPKNYYSDARNWRFPASLRGFGLEEEYIDKLAKIKMFCTVNQELISINDNPKIIEDAFPGELCGERFGKLLRPIQSEAGKRLISLISDRKNQCLEFGERGLCYAINAIADEWTVEQRVDVFIWWNKGKKRSVLPNLLKSQSGFWIRHGEECYLLEGDFDSVKIPEWALIPALDEDYQKILVSKSMKLSEIADNTFNKENRTSVIRQICQNSMFKTIKFKYTDRGSIISPINKSVNTYEKAVQFVKWLWDNYRLQWSNRDNGNEQLHFPATDFSINTCNKLYLGDDYGNTLARKLFRFMPEYKEFPKFHEFGIEETNKSEFSDFINRLGVLEFPAIELLKIENPISEYDKMMRKIIYEYDGFSNTQTTYVDRCKYTLPYILNLDGIIKNLSTEDVIQWIVEDEKLSECLGCKDYASGQKPEILYHGNRQKYDTVNKYRGKVRNYILATFNNTPWVKINGEPYSPRQILDGINTLKNEQFKKYVPVLTKEMVTSISKRLNITQKKIEEIFSNFGFLKRVTDLSSNDFYGLLIKLQKSEDKSDFEYSRVIYRLVENTNFTKTFEDSGNKEKFFEGGKLLVKYDGILQYWLAKESYLPSIKIINKKDFPIVEKGQRTNNSNFVRIFGCKEWESDYKIVPGSEVLSVRNGEFQAYFKEFIKYAKAYSERNDNVAKYVCKLHVELVSKVSILENEKQIQIEDDKSLLKSTTTMWYIVCKDSEYSIREISTDIETIFRNIANTTNFEFEKIGELFRASSKEDREFLIKKEFGSLEVIEDNSYSNEIRNNFNEAVKNLNKSDDVNVSDYKIDFDDFDCIDNSPEIIKLLLDLNVDILDFRNSGFVYDIDIRKFFKKQLEELVEREKAHFKDWLFEKAMCDDALQRSFLRICHKFDDIVQNVRIDNSVKYNPKNVLISEFGNWLDSEVRISADEEYEKNYKRINPNDLYKEIISNSEDVQRMLYFGSEDEFNQWLNEQKNKNSEAVNILDDNSYLEYVNVIPREAPIKYSGSPDEKQSWRKDCTNIHRTFSQTNHRSVEDKKKRNGNIGEICVYNLLCEKYGKGKVFPHSEAFEQMGIIAPGLGESNFYDISYIDESGKRIYVEVKTGDEKRFFMSPRELNFAKEHFSNYQLYYVSNLDSNPPTYAILPDEFWNDEQFKKEEIIEKIEFRF